MKTVSMAYAISILMIVLGAYALLKQRMDPKTQKPFEFEIPLFGGRNFKMKAYYPALVFPFPAFA